MEEIQKFIEEDCERVGTNIHWLAQYAEALNMYCRIWHDWDNPVIQAVCDYKGAQYTPLHLTLLGDAMNFLGWGDSGSSYVFEKQRAFTVWAIDRIKKIKFDALTDAKKARLSELKSERERIERELSELNKEAE